jgi:hypothetical protein
MNGDATQTWMIMESEQGAEQLQCENWYLKQVWAGSNECAYSYGFSAFDIAAHCRASRAPLDKLKEEFSCA